MFILINNNNSVLVFLIIVCTLFVCIRVQTRSALFATMRVLSTYSYIRSFKKEVTHLKWVVEESIMYNIQTIVGFLVCVDAYNGDDGNQDVEIM